VSVQRNIGVSWVLADREFVLSGWRSCCRSVGISWRESLCSVLVYQRTASASWTALTYALTYLPALVGVSRSLGWLTDIVVVSSSW